MSLTRRAALLGASAAALSACATAAAPPAADETAAFNAFLEEAFEVYLDTHPQLATSLGDRRNYGRWDDPSDAAEDEDLRLYEASVAEMRARFSPERFGADAKLSWRMYELGLRRRQEDRPWRGHAYQFNQMFGAQSQTPAFLINQHRVDAVADAEAYVARLQGMRDYLGAIVARSETSAARGLMPPRFVYDYVLSDARNVIAGAPFGEGPDSPIWADFKAKVGALSAADAEKSALLDSGRAALATSVKPAYDEIIAAMARQQAQAGSDDGVWRFADGAEYYAHQLRRMTTTDMTADEIHELGLSEVARIHADMDAIIRAVNFRGDRRAFFDFMATDQRFYVADASEGKAEYVRRATAAIDAMRPRLPDYFGRLPRAPLEVRQVEPFRERSAGLAFYNRPAMDGSRPGVYYVNTFIVRAIPTYQIEALAYHEGIPGHHMQIAIAQELEGVPRFRRLGGYTAYSEGWGLYAERLAKEMGFYQDPYSDFGRLTMELHRAIRLVVDTGLHHKRWTRQQAIDYTLANKPDAEPQARRDIDRYIVMPGQATAYKIGQIEILRLREEARAAMGARFDIRAFHDLVLGGGAVPLDVLRELVRGWSAT
jgi:uncharacterized protein (DUF885 family)